MSTDASRRRDLLLSAVLLGIVLTPGWLLPSPVGPAYTLVVGALGLPMLWWSWRHAPWQPTPRDELDRIVAALQLTPDQRFCDLGAGDGRLVLWVRKATGASCTGLEAAPLTWLVARARLAVQGDARTSVQLADLYRADLSAYDALYVWGTAYSAGTERFRDHVWPQLKPGARLVSYHHPVPGLEPDRVDASGERPLYVYRRAPASTDASTSRAGSSSSREV